jgi:hypothetical protein
MDLILIPMRAVSQVVRLLFKLSLVMLLVAVVAIAGIIFVKGSQPMGVAGVDPKGQNANLDDMSYWEFMSGSLAASRETPVNCHRTRLIYLAISLPVYPLIYTYVALYPDSYLAQHIQPSSLVPDPISLEQVPDTWWALVKEISWFAFTQPQWDYMPTVRERVKIDQSCILPSIQSKSTK